MEETKSVCGTTVGVGGEASHLWAVVKPPEEGQCSGVTWPNHRSQVSLLPPDGYNRSREIYTLHWTWGSNTYTTTHPYIYARVHTNKCTHTQNTHSANMEYYWDYSWCKFSSRGVFLYFPRLKCIKRQPWLKWNSAEWKRDYPWKQRCSCYMHCHRNE